MKITRLILVLNHKTNHVFRLHSLFLAHSSSVFRDLDWSFTDGDNLQMMDFPTNTLFQKIINDPKSEIQSLYLKELLQVWILCEQYDLIMEIRMWVASYTKNEKCDNGRRYH